MTYAVFGCLKTNKSMKYYFIGIDFSKETFDATLLKREELTSKGVHAKFDNSKKGYQQLISWAKRLAKSKTLEDVMFCGENTGTYSYTVANLLAKGGFFLWLESPLQINHSLGLRRGKNDKADSLAIALYAATHEAHAKRYEAPSELMESLRGLLSLRRDYVQQRSDIQRICQEKKRVFKHNSLIREEVKFMEASISRLNGQIKKIEKNMAELVAQNEQLQNNYNIITSMKGIGMINALALIITTDNFKRFDYDARKLASYYGVAPFEHSSGSSIKHSPHVSFYADKQLKSILSQAALSAIRFCPPITAYAERLAQRGKNINIIRNNVKCKILHILVAMVRDGRPFMLNPAKFSVVG